MAFTEGSYNGVIDQVAEIVVVPAPPVGTRRIVKNIVVYSIDGGDVVITLKNLAGIDTRIWTGWIPPRGWWQFGEIGDIIVLDTVDKYIVGNLLDPLVLAAPEFTSSYGDAS